MYWCTYELRESVYELYDAFLKWEVDKVKEYILLWLWRVGAEKIIRTFYYFLFVTGIVCRGFIVASQYVYQLYYYWAFGAIYFQLYQPKEGLGHSIKKRLLRRNGAASNDCLPYERVDINLLTRIFSFFRLKASNYCLFFRFLPHDCLLLNNSSWHNKCRMSYFSYKNILVLVFWR
jgi:hypothetical protein